jgi:hypothetical protein
MRIQIFDKLLEGSNEWQKSIVIRQPDNTKKPLLPAEDGTLRDARKSSLLSGV